MLTKEKALYQVKLILDYLPKEEYELISKETIDYIEKNYEYDENIKINPKIPLENQQIDEKTYEMLEKIINSAESNSAEEKKEENDAKAENIELKNIIQLLRKENAKIPKAKELIEEYKKSLKEKEQEIERLKEINESLYKNINKIPRFIRKIFVKDLELNYLIEHKN